MEKYLEAIIAAAAAYNPKPTEYKLGQNSLYIRRFTLHDKKRFFEEARAQQANGEHLRKAWVVCFGLCDDKNVPMFPTPADGETQLEHMALVDLTNLEELVYEGLGMDLETDPKKA